MTAAPERRISRSLRLEQLSGRVGIGVQHAALKHGTAIGLVPLGWFAGPLGTGFAARGRRAADVNEILKQRALAIGTGVHVRQA